MIENVQSGRRREVECEGESQSADSEYAAFHHVSVAIIHLWKTNQKADLSVGLLVFLNESEQSAIGFRSNSR